MGAKLSASRNTSIRELYQINRKRRSSMSKGTATTASSSGASSVEKSSPSIASEGTTDSTNLPYGTLKGEDDRMNANQFALKCLFEGNYLNSVGQNVDFNSSSTKVLDIGCGAGGWIMDIATEFPSAHFTGVDKVRLFPNCIYPENVSFQQMDVTDGLPFEDDTFDFVHLRLFVLAFNEMQWDKSLKEIYRVIKPGGYIQLMEVNLVDEGNQVVREFAALVAELMRSIDHDPKVCEKLPHLLSRNGFTPVEEVSKSIPLNNHPLASEFLFILTVSFDTCKPLIISMCKLSSEDEYQALKRNWIESRKKSSRTTWWAAVGRKPLQECSVETAQSQ